MVGDTRALDEVRVLQPLLAQGALESGGWRGRGIATARRTAVRLRLARRYGR